MTPLRRQIKRVSETKGLTIKQIVNLCECSRSHFYKVLDGQRTPSKDLQNKLMDVLELDRTEFDALLNSPEASEVQSSEAANHDKSTKMNAFISTTAQYLKSNSILFTALILITVISLGVYFNGFPLTSNTMDLELKTGYGTKFIKDVTIPDGSPIAVNTSFIKTWRVQNVGTITWQNKRLQRVTPQDPNLCYSVNSVELPTVKPGEVIDISIEFTTPPYPGTCRTDWKMVDLNGNFTFPSKQGLYSIIHVVEATL